MPTNFLAPESGPTDLESSRVVVLPAPFERSTSYGGGTRLGPQAIITASTQVEEYDQRLDGMTVAHGIHTAPPVEDDPALPAEEYLQRLQRTCAHYLEMGKLVVTLGGEHTLALATFRAHRERWPGLGVLQLDAHADLRDSYEGNPFSHASVMRRILEERPAAVSAVGIRSMCPEEAEFYRRREVHLVGNECAARDGSWVQRALAPLPEQVYLTIDVDVLDPSVMPATGTPEPGGLSWFQLLELLERLTRRHQVVGFDLVELSPVPGLHHAEFTCARLAYHLLGMILEHRR